VCVDGASNCRRAVHSLFEEVPLHTFTSEPVLEAAEDSNEGQEGESSEDEEDEGEYEFGDDDDFHVAQAHADVGEVSPHFLLLHSVLICIDHQLQRAIHYALAWDKRADGNHKYPECLQYRKVLDKVRKIVRKMKKSSTLKAALKQATSEVQGLRFLSLRLDQVPLPPLPSSLLLLLLAPVVSSQSAFNRRHDGGALLI